MNARNIIGAAAAILVVTLLLAGIFIVLKQQVIPVRERYEDLRLRYRKLEEEYASLADRLFSLQQSHQRPEEEYERLKANYTRLAKERAEERGELEVRIASLQKLLEIYQKIYTDYLILRGRASSIIGRTIRNGEHIQSVLRSPPTKNVLKVVSELGLRGEMEPAEKPRRVMEWMVVNTRYLQDEYIIVVANQSVTRVPEHVSAANETIVRGGGDCEDLAILAYALLRQVLRDGEQLRLIALTTGYTGHAAVLYGSDERYIILDPSVSYFTNSTIMMTIYFRDATVSITPIDLEPNLKKQLLEAGLAEITYHPKGVEPYTFLDLNSTIALWLNYAKGFSGEGGHTYVDRIINETIDRKFNSTVEFLAWMARR